MTYTRTRFKKNFSPSRLYLYSECTTFHNIAASFQVNALLIDITGTVSQENKTYINRHVSDDVIYVAASVQEHDCQICFAANLP